MKSHIWRRRLVTCLIVAIWAFAFVAATAEADRAKTDTQPGSDDEPTATAPTTQPTTTPTTTAKPAKPKTVPLSFKDAPLDQIAKFLTEQMGKPVGSDLRRNKRSLPIVHALAAAAEAGDAGLSGRLARGAATNEEAAEVAARMAELGSRSFCERMAQESLARALDALAGADLCQGPAADLRTLASYLMERTE